MLTFSLQSGSNGNSIYVEAGDVRLLFDAGITGAKAERRLAEHGREIRDVDALIISHDHGDHVRYAGVYQRKFKIPLYITSRTERSVYMPLGKLHDVRYFVSGDTISFGKTRVHTVRTPHDAKDGVAFVVEFEGRRLGILTDLGHPFEGLIEVLSSVDAAYLESNYDPGMLERGPYPPYLRQRIKGSGGHLSNDEAAALVGRCGPRRPGWIAVAHLSGENNTPQLAIEAQRKATGESFPIRYAPRDGCSESWCI